MVTPDAPRAGPAPGGLCAAVPARPLTSHAEFRGAVRDALLQAASTGVRELWWLADAWALWPLEEPAVLEALTAWARTPGVRLHWMSREFEALRRAMPRLVRWRQTFSHKIDCRCPDEQPGPALPGLLVADRLLVIRLQDAERLRGWVRHDAADVQAAHEQIDAISQRSSAAFPAVTLGL